MLVPVEVRSSGGGALRLFRIRNESGPLRAVHLPRSRRRHLVSSHASSRPRLRPQLLQRLMFYCRTTSASTAPCTSKRMCCPMHCANYCAPCQPLLRAFSECASSRPRRRPRRPQPPDPHRAHWRRGGGPIRPTSLLAPSRTLALSLFLSLYVSLSVLWVCYFRPKPNACKHEGRTDTVIFFCITLEIGVL